MLILSRREGEAILIEGGIRIVVVACDRRGVRLGIEAPPELGILREEIVVQIADENRRAGAVPEEAKAWLEVIPAAPAACPPTSGGPPPAPGG